jgi:hypothetical protein
VSAQASIITGFSFAAPSLDAQDIVPTLYDPEEFAALEYADKYRTVALIATMSEAQHVREALAYAAWLASHGLKIDLETVLAISHIPP